MLLVQFRFDIYSALIKINLYFYMVWCVHVPDWSNHEDIFDISTHSTALFRIIISQI